MAFKFSKPLDVFVASSIKLPTGVYWNMNSNQSIIGLYKNPDECDINSLQSLAEEIETQAQEIPKPNKTPEYVLKSQRAYVLRKLIEDPEYIKRRQKKYYEKKRQDPEWVKKHNERDKQNKAKRKEANKIDN